MIFDYKRRQRYLSFCYIGNALGVLLSVLSAFFSVNNLSKLTWLDMLTHLSAYLLQNFVAATVLATYFCAIFGIRHRFNIINSLIRLEIQIVLEIFFICHLSGNYLGILARKQFSNKNVVKKKDVIAFIKQMGRLHSMLCGLMDKLNFCYSFQVSSIEFKIPNYRSFRISYFRLCATLERLSFSPY